MSSPEEQDLVDVLESSPVGAVILDRGGIVLFWNSSLLEILGGLQGAPFAAAAGQGFFAQQTEFAEACAVLARGKEVRNHPVQIAGADGLEVWAAVSMRSITFEHQAAMLVWYFDITASRNRERALERTQDTLLEVLDAAPVGAAICEGPGRVSFWNNALIEQLSEVDEPDLSTVIREGVALASAKVAELGPGRPFRLPRPDGVEKWITAWQSPIEFEGGAANLVWIQNVTDLRRAEMEAERATRSKSSFLATMSHEIRTPMNGVRTIAELLFGTALDDEQQKMVTTIKDSADALVTILNDILDFSKVEAGELRVSSHPFELSRVVDGVIQLLRPKAEEKGLSLLLRSVVALDGWHFGDEMRLRQILLNLIGNAIKFTAAGAVTLEIVADAIGIRFNVIDTGIGIAAAHVKDLFMPFKQADASTARLFGGTGLGLSICKELVRMLGGKIGVETVLGSGSTFWLTLPLPAVAPVEIDGQVGDASQPYRQHWRAPDRQLAEQHGAVVLCAEDNPTNRDVLTQVLRRLGVVFDMVENGSEALQRFDRRIHGLLLTDGHMPVMDGWSLARHIRAGEAEQNLPRVPIVALTADAVTGIAEQCRLAGMDGFLIKPLGIALTDGMLCRWSPILATLRVADHPVVANPAPAVPAAPRAIDLAMLVDLVGQDFDMIDSMLQGFFKSATTLVGAIMRHIEADEAADVRRHAHSLASAALYVGAQGLSDAAAAVEQAASEGRADALPALAHPLETLLSEVGTAIALHRAEGAAAPPADRAFDAAKTILDRAAQLPGDDVAAIYAALVVLAQSCGAAGAGAPDLKSLMPVKGGKTVQ